MFGNWGGAGRGDLNEDGFVDAADAGIMFAEWTGDTAPVNHIATATGPASPVSDAHIPAVTSSSFDRLSSAGISEETLNLIAQDVVQARRLTSRDLA